jgi:hypothetical protein
MPLREHIYRTARFTIERHGDQAVNYADRIFRYHLEKEDLRSAGDWLRIGSAIEDLTNLPPRERRH